MSKLTTRDMSNAHEKHLQETLGGRRTKNSGAIFNDQMDGRHNHRDQSFAFAWDGKATLGKSISVPLEMWTKAVDQAAHERPMLALRWYADERLHVKQDLVVLDLDDFAELLERANGNS